MTCHSPRAHTLALTLALGGLLGLLHSLASDARVDAQSPPIDLTRAAVGDDAPRAEQAIAALRAEGPAGLARLLEAHNDAVHALNTDPLASSNAASERLRHAIDVVSGQRDGHASGLYFYDDLPRALAEARARHVPVLSLRLLGRLDEELSCANSRYFRTIVYSDESVATFLREHFVLHASTERPAPTITIDMGDGRTMVRTITGNSIHYVLDGNGRVVDALPGLYAPPQFVAALTAAVGAFTRCNGAETERYGDCLTTTHRMALADLEQRWLVQRSAAGANSLPEWQAFTRRDDRRVVGPGAPSARQAMAETMSKMSVEAALLDSFVRTRTPEPYEGINWPRLVGRADFALSARSLALVRLKNHSEDVRSIALELARNAVADGLRNEFVMHRRIHEWLAAAQTPIELAPLNTRVYAELFLTPASDPWLGLRAADVWDAIETLH